MLTGLRPIDIGCSLITSSSPRGRALATWVMIDSWSTQCGRRRRIL